MAFYPKLHPKKPDLPTKNPQAREKTRDARLFSLANKGKLRVFARKMIMDGFDPCHVM